MTAMETTDLTVDQTTDEEVVRRVVAGNIEMFEILMRRNNQRIYRTVLAVLGHADGVEDVMQQTYFNAYEHLNDFAGESRFSTWLTRIAVNEALRRRQRERIGSSGDGGNFEDSTPHELRSAAPDPEQIATTSELREVLEREVARLPDVFRAVLMMRDVEGMTTSETATCLGISEALVKTRLHRSRSRIRQRLDQAGIDVQSTFTFGNSRCDLLVSTVVNALFAADVFARAAINVR
jgi:RNA polymerase sigma-70 factor (ECF subfamily)